MKSDGETTSHATTWQTVGPFFKIGLAWLYRDNLAGLNVAGERVEITGLVLDGDGVPVPDAVLELWQANSHGKYAHPEDIQQKMMEQDFSGFGRIATDESGRFRFTTIKPGRVPAPGSEGSGGSGATAALQAPHIAVSICTRGLLRRLITRIYFPDEPSNAEDFALSLVEPSRRATLIAKKVIAKKVIAKEVIAKKIEGRLDTLEWNVVLQGPNETVFFDV